VVSIGRAYSALQAIGSLTQGFALGCDGVAPLGLGLVPDLTAVRFLNCQGVVSRCAL
jgi:hypothetical protein